MVQGYYILVGGGGGGLVVAGMTVAVVVCILLDDWASVDVAEAVVERVVFGRVLYTFQF